jgi:hypothetical protein
MINYENEFDKDSGIVVVSWRSNDQAVGSLTGVLYIFALWSYFGDDISYNQLYYISLYSLGVPLVLVIVTSAAVFNKYGPQKM